MNHSLNFRTALVLMSPITALLGVFFLWPLGVVAWTSFQDGGFSLRGYEEVMTSALVRRILANTFHISIVATLVSLVLGYAIAMHLCSVSPRRRVLYLLMVMLPFWTSILVKSFALTIILGDAGLINWLFGAVSGGLWQAELIFNRIGVIIGMTHYLLPFMVLPILASLLSQDPTLRLAAQIMGAGPIRVFWSVTLPLSLPGVLAGVLMCMTLSMGMYITPALLGGRRDMMMANLVDFYTRQTLDWTLAAAIAMTLLLLSAMLIALLIRVRPNEAGP
jgi:putative spermidine/putrescine transport system permease protein